MVSSILSTYTSIQMSHTAVILSVKRDDNSMRRLNHKSSLSQGQNCYTKWGLCASLKKPKEFGSLPAPLIQSPSLAPLTKKFLNF